MTVPNKMQHIDPASLTELSARIAYLSSFLEVTDADSEMLRAAKPLIAPLVPTVLEAVYTKLLSYDITAKAFVPRNTDYDGETPTDVSDLNLEHPQIAYRKDFLKNYILKLVATSDLSPTSQFWVYLDKVGIMHTGQPGFKRRENKPELRVEYIHMAALLGYVLNVVIGAVMTLDIDTETKSKVILAFNKVLWIQNDLFSRHYIGSGGANGA